MVEVLALSLLGNVGLLFTTIYYHNVAGNYAAIALNAISALSSAELRVKVLAEFTKDIKSKE